jgi:hypothetical protein
MSNDNYRNVYKSDHLGAVDLEEFIEAAIEDEPFEASTI